MREFNLDKRRPVHMHDLQEPVQLTSRSWSSTTSGSKFGGRDMQKETRATAGHCLTGSAG
ncbi:uncharacterized protein ColSpa_00891 [Colletotrichum spaethianum]|uniref:Uncharacterized protein n=1 Tax=Colletotrichum spaethianum TaxID=700344 RepID=A0AA37L5T7_9PEZI|nr:uncharacterized protein ColSpa_00891 [Colletotrichum spaethianum]GKT40710.1 hypothetical protein ColSpa_00891 [Colletotrichum spaethianum]